MRLQDQVAIITGAAGAGIGQTTARRFAQEGARIVVSDTHPRRTEEVAQAIASEYGVTTLGIVCDVTARDQVDALVQQTMEALGRVDILVNNAGRNTGGWVRCCRPGIIALQSRSACPSASMP